LPTVIDSLFLELGIDVSRFSADEQKALTRIKQFESQTKRAAAGAKGGIKTVGDAFRDLAKESRIGSSADRLDNLATKFKSLGASMQVSGGAGTPFGAMATGLGMLLSPAALGIAAVGLLGKGVWDLNKDMTAFDATLARNAELTGMSATNLWAMGEAAQTVGGNPAAVQASIASLQTTLAGASIGVGSAMPQLIGMGRLAHYGARYNNGRFGQGVNEESLFKAVHAYYQSQGGANSPGARARTMALVTGYGLMNDDQASLAMSSGGWNEYKKAQAQAQAMKTGGGFEAVVRKSLGSQVGLGEADITQSVLAEQGYGGIQGGMQTVVGLLTDVRGFLSGILNNFVQLLSYLTGGKAADAAQSAVDAVKQFGNYVAPGTFAAQSPEAVKAKERIVLDVLRKAGESPGNAAAMAGNFNAESNLDPFATSDNGAHIGIQQLDRTRQAAFAKWAGYRIGPGKVSPTKQLIDQVAFSVFEMNTNPALKKAQLMMDAQSGLFDKTKAFQDFYEMPGANDRSFDRRWSSAKEAANLMRELLTPMLDAATAPASNTAHNDNRSTTKIGDVHVHTPSTDPKAHAAAVRKGLSDQPLLNPTAQGMVSLATRGMVA
jgi:hypothetical protein